MRVASFQFQMQWLATVMDQRAAIDRLQLQIGTGRRILQPSDDPAAAARVVELDSAREAARQYTENGGVVRERLASEDSLLAQAGNLLQRVRERAVQAANATTGADGRQAIAVEMRQSLQSLLAIANSKDARGEYVFAGLRATTQAFVGNGGGAVYAGDDAQRFVRVGADQLIADRDSGEQVFNAIPTGSGLVVARASATNTGTLLLGTRAVVDPVAWDGGSYTVQFVAPDSYEVRDAANAVVQAGTYAAGDSITFRGLSLSLSGVPAAGDTLSAGPSGTQSVFQTIDRLAQALESATPGSAAQAATGNVVGDSLEDLDRALERIGEVRAQVGGRLQAIDQSADLLADQSISLTAEISGLRDVDLTEALSSLSNLLTGLDASQQAYTRLQGLSLFNYLR
ncbi:MAG: flagellar hook-associated protein FlgL [Steroidobacteraceae bacterium]|nr:flagellar hook-associated protein FlgL [Pseudomonadota bacterium]MBP6106605.1 flagellar hook-associated protein FlgL [Steroidobacteraceae bacterium]MBP7014348.1 flagellar hook-associated protein FlgL [Steroidobacteraceae bacterium]